MTLINTSRKYFKWTICFLSVISLTNCYQKSNELSADQSVNNKVEDNYTNTALIDFANQINYNKHRFDGVNAMAYELMHKAYPNGTYTDLISKIEEMPNNLEVENTFLKALYRQSANPETVHFFIYSLSHSRQTTQIVEEYCNSKFHGQ